MVLESIRIIANISQTVLYNIVYCIAHFLLALRLIAAASMLLQCSIEAVYTHIALDQANTKESMRIAAEHSLIAVAGAMPPGAAIQPVAFITFRFRIRQHYAHFRQFLV
jgi:hypothetical protein